MLKYLDEYALVNFEFTTPAELVDHISEYIKVGNRFPDKKERESYVKCLMENFTDRNFEELKTFKEVREAYIRKNIKPKEIDVDLYTENMFELLKYIFKNNNFIKASEEFGIVEICYYSLKTDGETWEVTLYEAED